MSETKYINSKTFEDYARQCKQFHDNRIKVSRSVYDKLSKTSDGEVQLTAQEILIAKEAVM